MKAAAEAAAQVASALAARESSPSPVLERHDRPDSYAETKGSRGKGKGNSSRLSSPPVSLKSNSSSELFFDEDLAAAVPPTESSPESERPSATRDASSSPFALVPPLMVITAESSCQTDEALFPAIPPPSPPASSPPVPVPVASTALPLTKQQTKKKTAATAGGVNAGPSSSSSSAPARTVSSATLKLVVGAVAVLTAALVLVVTRTGQASFLFPVDGTSSDSGESSGAAKAQQNQAQAPLLHQSTLWVLPNTSIILAPSQARFYDATGRRFLPPPIPAHLPVAQEIGQVRRWRYEWRWEWERNVVGSGDCAGGGGVLVSSSSKSATFLLRHREDLDEDVVMDTTTASLFCPSSHENFVLDGAEAAAGANTLPPPPLATWNGTQAALASLFSLSGTYTSFLRLYKMNHAGGEGAISLPATPDAPSQKATRAPITLLQSYRLSSQSVQVAAPPRPKTRVGAYYPKKLGERLELIVSASGNPTPEFTWYKNGFLLQRQMDEKDKPHILVLDKLTNVRLLPAPPCHYNFAPI